MSEYLVIQIEYGSVEADNIDHAIEQENKGMVNWGTSETIHITEGDEHFSFLKLMGFSSIIELLEENKRLKKNGIFWDVDDFESRATENEDGSIIYDRSKFDFACKRMLKKYDSGNGISWSTVDNYLYDYCRTDFNKEFAHIWIEIPYEKVKKLWNEDVAIFEYSFEHDADRQMNYVDNVELPEFNHNLNYFLEKAEP